MINTNLPSLTSDFLEVLNGFTVVEPSFVTLNFFVGEIARVEVAICDKNYTFEYAYAPKNQIEEKRLTKRFSKLSLYRALVDFTGISLPWGALTGVRPTKLAYQNKQNWQEFFKDTMFVSDNKIALIDDVLKSQEGIYTVDSPSRGLFVSIPFCPTRCAYCSFISNEICKEKRINEYIDRLIEEIEAAKPLVKDLRSIYIGGGTPVSLTNEHFERLLKAIGKNCVEYTIEAGRPDCITREKLEIMKKYGVTRVCVNPQTFQDKTLELIGRRHTAKDVIEKFHLVKEYGFDVNMDLIAGLTGESFNDFKDTLNTAISLKPENITVHTLCLKKGSKLKESTKCLSDGDVAKMVEFARLTLNENGYKPYYLYRQKYMAGNHENVGYALSGKQCIYNIDIMEETTDIVACGANAISKKVGKKGGIITRIAAPKDILSYINRQPQIILEKNSLFN